jgi:hypothetical protein
LEYPAIREKEQNMLTIVKQEQATRMQGVVARLPEAADEVQLIVLNSLGEVVSKSARGPLEAGLQVMDFERDLRSRVTDGLAFGLLKGLRKGVVIWERRLGRLSL